MSDPPLMVRIDDLVGGDPTEETLTSLVAALASYRETLTGDKQHLLEEYRFATSPAKSSVLAAWAPGAGLRSSRAATKETPWSSRIKEAYCRTVAASYLGDSPFTNQGQRVVEGHG